MHLKKREANSWHDAVQPALWLQRITRLRSELAAVPCTPTMTSENPTQGSMLKACSCLSSGSSWHLHLFHGCGSIVPDVLLLHHWGRRRSVAKRLEGLARTLLEDLDLYLSIVQSLVVLLQHSSDVSNSLLRSRRRFSKISLLLGEGIK